jgi:flagellar basal body P-ring formation protein FlgA
MMKKLLPMSALLHVAAVACAWAQDAQTNVTRIVVPTHDIARGEVIDKSDLSYQTVPATRSLSEIATSMNDLDGREARRLLRAGETVRVDDVRRPVLVTKGSTVTMTFEAPGITLTAVGRAVSEGGLGESVVVLNPVSYRQVTATVTGAGQVKALDSSPVIAASQAP